jgi:SAM-dependent methyltransferase
MTQTIAFVPKDPPYYNNQKSIRFMPFIPEKPSIILELGCSSGQLGQAIRQNGRAAELVGVELFPAAAEQSKKYFDTVYCGDIEQISLTYENYFDVVICGDILEHLRDPSTVTHKIYRWLKNGGTFISTVPNIRNWSILLDLIFRGMWRYSKEGGILDDTHLRFFTRNTFFEMLKNAKFKIIHHEMIIHGRKYKLINAALLGMAEEFIGEQVFVVAKKL